MKGNNGIFVKVNYKNMGELQSFIYDMTKGNKEKDHKYVMCAGKYNKDGWTIVFKAKDINELEKIVSLNNERRNKIVAPEINQMILENDTVSIPSWL